MIGAALERLKIAKLLNGYRGKPAADKSAIVAAIMAVQDYVINNAIGLAEVEVISLAPVEFVTVGAEGPPPAT